MGKVVYTRDADGFMALLASFFEFIKVILIGIFGILMVLYTEIIRPASKFIYKEYIKDKISS